MLRCSVVRYRIRGRLSLELSLTPIRNPKRTSKQTPLLALQHVSEQTLIGPQSNPRTTKSTAPKGAQANQPMKVLRAAHTRVG